MVAVDYMKLNGGAFPGIVVYYNTWRGILSMLQLMTYRGGGESELKLLIHSGTFKKKLKLMMVGKFCALHMILGGGALIIPGGGAFCYFLGLN